MADSTPFLKEQPKDGDIESIPSVTTKTTEYIDEQANQKKLRDMQIQEKKYFIIYV